jgi:hypothetical protein
MRVLVVRTSVRSVLAFGSFEAKKTPSLDETGAVPNPSQPPSEGPPSRRVKTLRFV